MSLLYMPPHTLSDYRAHTHTQNDVVRMVVSTSAYISCRFSITHAATTPPYSIPIVSLYYCNIDINLNHFNGTTHDVDSPNYITNTMMGGLLEERRIACRSALNVRTKRRTESS